MVSKSLEHQSQPFLTTSPWLAFRRSKEYKVMRPSGPGKRCASEKAKKTSTPTTAPSAAERSTDRAEADDMEWGMFSANYDGSVVQQMACAELEAHGLSPGRPPSPPDPETIAADAPHATRYRASGVDTENARLEKTLEHAGYSRPYVK